MRVSSLASAAAVALLLAALAVVPSSAFYIPGISPTDYKEGDPIDLWVNKVFSSSTQLPYEYLRLPVCKPTGEKVIRENIGEVLRGDRIIRSNVKINMLKDVPCEVMCQVSVTEKEATWLRHLIQRDYKVEWYVDELPGATPYRTSDKGNKMYDLGFKLGAVSDKGIVMLHNHFKMVIMYHKDPAEYDGYRIVGFEVYPRSFESSNNPGCPAPEVLASTSAVPQVVGQEAFNVVYTYSVEFMEEPDVTWAKRWDLYLTSLDPQIHWFSLINSILILLVTSCLVALILFRTLRNEILEYNDEEKDEQDDVTGWKLLHGDVFRPPPYGWLLAVVVGSGVQLLCMVLLTLFLAMIGLLNPSYRGGLITFTIVLYVLMGFMGGYVSARLYKTFRGSSWKKNALFTAVILPGIAFTLVFILNLLIWSQGSSSALPFGTFVALIALWFCVSTPLVFAGAYFGSKKKPIEHPVRTNQIPRQIPEQTALMHPMTSILIAGAVEFIVIFVELFFVMKSVWHHQYYYMFGFLAIIFTVLIIVCIEVTLLAIYWLLSAEVYHWWWRAFFVSAGSTVYLFGYTVYYYITQMQMYAAFVPGAIYFVHVIIGCMVYAAVTGAPGFIACYYGLLKIYSAVKVD